MSQLLVLQNIALATIIIKHQFEKKAARRKYLSERRKQFLTLEHLWDATRKPRKILREWNFPRTSTFLEDQLCDLFQTKFANIRTSLSRLIFETSYDSQTSFASRDHKIYDQLSGFGLSEILSYHDLCT